MTARLTERVRNRTTLQRQLLLQREAIPVVDAVRRIVALQAQDPVGPYLALWARIADFDPREVDEAYASGDLVRAHLMRVTIHTVAAADHRAFQAAVMRTLRAARLWDERFTRAGLSIDETDALIPDLAAFLAEPRATEDVEAWLDERIGVRERPGVWWAVRHFGPFVHAPTESPWAFGSKRVMVAVRDATGEGMDEATALPILVRRWLAGFGPATPTDLRGALLVRADGIRAAIESLGDELVRFEGGYLDLADAPPLPDEDVPAPPRLLPMWDSMLLAHADRSRFFPPELRPHVIRRNGDVLPSVLVDGFVAGVWRPAEEAGLEVTALAPIDDEAWAAIDTEARSLDALLAARERSIYRRQQTWWSAMPGVEVRIVGR